MTTVDVHIRGADRRDSFSLGNGLFGPATTAFHTLLGACRNGFAIGDWSYSHADVIVTGRIVRAMLTGLGPLEPPYHLDEDNERLAAFRTPSATTPITSSKRSRSEPPSDTGVWPRGRPLAPGRIYDVSAPVLLITGASSGIGAATARLAAGHGWRVALAARSQDALDDLAAALGGPEPALAISCDITDWDQVTSLASQVMQGFRRLDAVFANAGYYTPTSFLHGAGTPEQWRQMVLTNVYGTALVARATLPILARSRGHLLLTGSVAGRVTVPGQLYSATK